MSKRKFSGNISGKGYYIALILCVAAIGITGYLYYRNANDIDPQLREPTVDVNVQDPTGDGVQAIVTQPNATENTTPTQPAKPFQTVAPVDGEMVTVHAMDSLTYNPTTRDWRVHNGIDIAAPEGSTVCAAADGTVYTIYEDETMGTTVVIRHADSYITKYSSLAEDLAVSVGDAVQAGDAIGCVGNTALLESAIGDHLHFSVTCGGAPVDPMEFLQQE